jgi:hypothetical protein
MKNIAVMTGRVIAKRVSHTQAEISLQWVSRYGP